MNKPLLLLLVAVTICCCITSLHGCRCIRTVRHQVPARIIRKVELTPVSGDCRRTEIIITRRNGSKVCVHPDVKWLPALLSTLQRRNETLSSTPLTPTATPTVNV